MEESTGSSRQPLFNPRSPDFIRDPYPTYARLRETEPIHESPLVRGYVLSRHKEIGAVLRDRRFGKGFAARILKQYGPAGMAEPIFRSQSRAMLRQDPPEHTRLRGLVSKAFTTRQVESIRGRVQAIVDRSIDRVESQRCMDIIADFALPLSGTVICDMLGIPEEDRSLFFDNDRWGARLLEPLPLSRAEIDAANEGLQRAMPKFERLFALRRREPKDDLTSLLVQAEENGERLDSEELYANVMLLFNAGHVTTMHLIGNALLALHRTPDQLDLLRNNPDLMPNTVEECLRYNASIQATVRSALEDLELGGRVIKAGTNVVCLLGSANHDPELYPDNPSKLDIRRADIKPHAFGGGVHFCIGAQLARIETEIALSTLLRRLPDLRIDDLDTPEWNPTLIIRGLNRLKASW